MCGRFNILTDAAALMATFEILEQNSQLDSFGLRYNISPSPRNTPIRSRENDELTRIPIIKLSDENERILCSAIWPLVPIWAGAEIPKYSTANARSETMRKLPSFRNAWKHDRRCLIPATGFYEWQIVPHQRVKQPWHIQHKEQSVMSFSGLWERGVAANGEEFYSCTIVTTAANSLMAEIHNSNKRMPVIIDPKHRDQWLRGDKESTFNLLGPYTDGRLSAYPISTRINNPKFSGMDCIEPIESNGDAGDFRLTS